MQKKIFYWSPHINDQIATVKAVTNSAHSLSKYSERYKPYIINAFGEWNVFSSKLKSLNISTIKIFDFKIKLPINGFIKSRIFYILFSIIIFFPLVNLIRKEKPDFVIIHLITIPVLVASLFFKKTKFILRISGFPKLNILRKFFWRLLSKNICKIFTPTRLTKNILNNEKIFDEKKTFVVEDPIIQIREIVKLRGEKLTDLPRGLKYIVSVGRLTKQKNFSFLINSFAKLKKELKDIKLLIIGSGEDQKNLINIIKSKNLENEVILKSYQTNIFKYIDKSFLFILSSDWEDPGFVIIEAAVCNKFIITSNVESGPREFIENQKSGFLFEKNNFLDLRSKILDYLKSSDNEILKMKVSAKLKSKKFTIFHHYRRLNKLLDN